MRELTEKERAILNVALSCYISECRKDSALHARQSDREMSRYFEDTADLAEKLAEKLEDAEGIVLR